MQVQAEMLRSSLPQNRSQAVPGNAAHGLGTESWFQRSDGPGLLQPVSSTMPTAHPEGSCKEGGGQQQLGICLTAAIDWLTLTCTVHDDMHSAAVGQGLRLAPGSAFQYATQPRHAVHVSDRCVVHNGAGQYHFHISSFCPAQSQAQTPETVSIDPVRTDRHLEAQVTTGGRGHQQFDHGGDYTNRPVCFFLHGFLGDADDWSPIMKALAMTHECIALDLPGHGRTCVHPSGKLYAHINTCSLVSCILFFVCIGCKPSKLARSQCRNDCKLNTCTPWDYCAAHSRPCPLSTSCI